MMPGMWNDSIKNITQQFPDVPIVIVSVKEDFDSIHNSISLGASGFIPKTSAPEVTISAIQLGSFWWSIYTSACSKTSNETYTKQSTTLIIRILSILYQRDKSKFLT